MTDATAEARWAALPDSHPAPGKPGTNRVPAVRTGNLVYLSGHGPAPGPDGKVAMPNINTMEEMVNLMTASRTYEANVTAINVSKNMMQKALEIGRK